MSFSQCALQTHPYYGDVRGEFDIGPERQIIIRPSRDLRIALAAMFIFAFATAAFAEPGQMHTYATRRSIGVRLWPLADDVAGAKLMYRRAGRATWQQAMDPVIAVANRTLDEGSRSLEVVQRDIAPMIRRLHGSIMYLEPGTEYEVRLQEIGLDGSIQGTHTTVVRTRPSTVSQGNGHRITVNRDGTGDFETINDAIAAACPGDMVIVMPGVYSESIKINTSGTPGKPITIRGAEGAILDDAESGKYLIQFADGCHDVILERFDIRATSTQRRRHVHVGPNVERLVIQDNHFHVQQCAEDFNFLAFWSAKDFRDITIQHNTFESEKKLQYPWHISGSGRGLIIRGNSISVGETQDIAVIRGRHEDVDIYDNYFSGIPSDDGIELEGGVNINVRMWNNVIDAHEGKRATISVTPVTVGPVYVFRNIFLGARQGIKVANDGVADALAAGHELADFGPVLFLHNTFAFVDGHDAFAGQDQPFFRFPELHHANIFLWNNLIFGRTIRPETARNSLSMDRTTVKCGHLQSDYNLFWDGQTTDNPNAEYGLGTHSVFQDPQFTPTKTWPMDVQLQANSPAIDRGLRVPNINDGYKGRAPDIGAIEAVSGMQY